MSRWKVTSSVNLYFITTTITEWQSVFVAIPFFETLIESLKYCRHHKNLHLHGYVIMPNHAHYIVSTEPPGHLSEIMRDYNRYTSQRITTLLVETQRADVLKIFSTAASEERRKNSFERN